jgi:hypothetical protein
VARVSYFYGMSYPAVLAMPLRAFWAYNRSVDRLRAEADQRHLSLLCASQDPKAAEQLGEKLSAELGSPVVVVKPFDAEQFKRLAEEMNGQKVPVG